MGGYRATDPVQCRNAYATMQRNGSLSRREAEIVAVLLRMLDPMTAGEIAEQVPKGNRNNVATRLSELAARDAVEAAETRSCRVTKSACYAWVLTGRPIGPKKKAGPSKAKQLEELLYKVGNALGDAPQLSRAECHQWSKRINERVTEIKGDE